MPVRCALGCERPGVHIFPHTVKFPEKFEAWVCVLNGKLETAEDYELYRTKRICAIHFKKEDYMNKNRLNAEAVPSLHLPAWCSPPLQQNQQHTSEPNICSMQSILTITKMPEPSALRIINPNSFLSSHSTQFEEKAKMPEPSALRIINPNSFLSSHSTQFEEKVSENIVPTSDDGSTSKDTKQGILPSDSTVVVKEEPRSLSPERCLVEHNYYWIPKPNKKRNKYQDLSACMTKITEQTKHIRNLKTEILRLRKRSVAYKMKLKEANKVIRQYEKHIKELAKNDLKLKNKKYIKEL